MRWIWLLLFVAATAAIAAVPPQATPEQIDQAVRDLGSEDYPTREKASEFLWAVGTPAEPALRKALQSNDTEVVSRARELLDKIPYGITPETPKKMVGLITRARAASVESWPDIVAELFDDGPEGLELAKQIAAKQGDLARQFAFRRGIDKVSWRLAPRLVIDNRLDLAEDALGRSAATQAAIPTPDFPVLRSFAAAARLRGTLAAERQKWEKWTDGPHGTDGFVDDQTPGGPSARVVAIFLAKAAGNFEKAEALARNLSANPWGETTRFDARHWAELAKLPTAGRAVSSGSYVSDPQPILRPILKTLYFGLTDQTAEHDKASAEVMQVYEANKNLVMSRYVFANLTYDRRPGEALEFAEKSTDFRMQLARGEILMQMGRPAEAVKALQNIASKQPADQTVAKQPTDQMVANAALARVFALTGDKESLASTLAEFKTEPYRSAPAQAAANEAISRFLVVGLQDAAIEQTGALIQGGVEPGPALTRLCPKTPIAAESWYLYFERSPGLSTPAEAIKAILPLVDHRLAGESQQRELEQALKWVNARPSSERGRLLCGFAEACYAAGLTDRAIALVRQAADLQPAQCLLPLGDMCARAGRWADAATAYEKAMQLDPMQAVPRYLTGLAMQKAGDVPRGLALQLSAQLLLQENRIQDNRKPGTTKPAPGVSRDEIARMQFCTELAQRTELAPEVAQVVRQQRQLLVDLSFPWSPYARTALAYLCRDDAAYDDKLVTAAANESLFLRTMQTRAFMTAPSEDFLASLHRLYAARARGYLAKDDLAKAMEAADKAHEVLPPAIDLAVEFIPELARRGHKSEGDAYYGRISRVLDGLCKEYPNSASYLNQRAWLAARCHRDLESAETWAKSAVSLAPESLHYLDTLAEVQFQRNDAKAALATLKIGLEKSPRNPHFLKMVQRVEAGDTAVPPPATAP
ncbi:MAG: hypothetical protein ACJ8C4_13670 [Gemmataceae bacterium]